MISLLEFQSVFQPIEAPAESNYEIAADWLLNSKHTEPTQRVKAALKDISKSSHLTTLLHQYQNIMRSDINDLDISSIEQLKKIKEYFLFPLYHLKVTEFNFISFERCLNSLIKSKINTLNLSDSEFLSSIDMDLMNLKEIKYEDDLDLKIQSFKFIWNQSILDQFSNNDLFKKKLAKLRINEIYSIVLNYPSSIPALYDLKNSIDPSQRSNLISSFISNCNQNLLHAGTNTNDIILFYISTIKSFLIIDPRSVLLDNASRPIRKYLKERNDTIKNLVNGLLNYNSINPLKILSDELSIKNVNKINNLTLDWFPDPIDALPDFRKQDIIESLISIFDSKDIFITELVSEFSKKLLKLNNYDINDINLKLNQLKWKFNENDLHNLDIMLKDIQDSDIINNEIHKNLNIWEKLNFTLISHLYWPEYEVEKFNLPPQISNQINSYFLDYKSNQRGRNLNWLNLGIVEVQLELKSKVLNLLVSPSQASIIYSFNDIQSLNFDELKSSLDMQEELLLNDLNFWINLEILRFENNKYIVNE